MAKISYPNGLRHDTSDVLLTASVSGFVGMCIGVAALLAASNGLLGPAAADIFTSLGSTISAITFLTIPGIAFAGAASCASSLKGFFDNRQTKLESKVNKQLGPEFNVQKFGNELTAKNVHTYILDLKTGKSEVVCIAFKEGMTRELHVKPVLSVYSPGIGYTVLPQPISFTDEPGLESFVDKVLRYSQMTDEQKNVIDRMRHVAKAPPEPDDRSSVEQKAAAPRHDNRPRPSERAIVIADPLHHPGAYPEDETPDAPQSSNPNSSENKLTKRKGFTAHI